MPDTSPVVPSEVAYCKIYPGIGIARVGNSADGFFIGPEAPGRAPEPEGGFRDATGHVKRQAARFRIYAFDSSNRVLHEITASSPGAQIEWTVQLANTKAAWFNFNGVAAGLQTDQHGTPAQRRNSGITQDRGRLAITPPAKSISGRSQQGAAHRFSEGKFFDIPVPLGELRTDEEGRLLVLGGAGLSSRTAAGGPITEYANNDFWHDDTSDGPVTAKVRVAGQEIPVKGTSWVLVAPPKFAPYHQNIVTLYELMDEVGQGPVPATLSFRNDIYPFFARVADYQWLNRRALQGHGPNRGGNFRDPAIAARLADNTPGNQSFRQGILTRVRNPRTHSPAEANSGFMPILSGDEGDTSTGDPSTWLYVLASQYAMLEQWVAGNFQNDWTGTVSPPPAFAAIAVADQPAALDRAALENCVGGPFFPGIEMTYIARDTQLYEEPFRFKAGKFQPGDMTKRMAVPWQADFYECEVHWWPAQRPDDVLTEDAYNHGLQQFPQQAQNGTLAAKLTARVLWARGVGDGLPQPSPGDNDMVKKWSALGFLEQRITPGGETLYVEKR
ncbi:MAG TPA: LodA/GoxA family CTQ-dependent oxidase [Chthoniobacteraceae bacterium]|jgi:hypothetical protein|nr:LodA/GoxA family CTQ-dependent oxidase [Chthoniobacteraceae bacterium]